MRKFVVFAFALAGAVTTTGAFAQGSQPQGTQPQGGMMHAMPMQQGQQGGMMGCPMMQRVASMDTRLRQLEERAGIPAPPTQPAAPGNAR